MYIRIQCLVKIQHTGKSRKELIVLQKEKVDLQAEIEKHNGSHKVLLCLYFLHCSCGVFYLGISGKQQWW